MKTQARVITTLCERLELEQRVRALLAVVSEEELIVRARQIAEAGGGEGGRAESQVVPLILGYLEKGEPRLVNVLGVIASLYPDREAIVSRLYDAAADVTRPDRARVSAMLILERFLGQKLDSRLVHSLDDPRAVAIQSVKEMLTSAAEDPSLIIEYAQALSEQPDRAAPGVVETLVEVGGAQAVPMLCQLAQQENALLAGLALKALGQIRHPDTVRGLQALIPLLPPRSRAGGERGLLKLQLAGVPVPPLPAAGPAWRALISPVDGMGSQVVWFLRDADADGMGLFLGLSLHDRDGIVKAYGRHRVPGSALPGRARPGHIHRVPMQSIRAERTEPGGRAPILHMLEADFGHGRRLVGEAQARNFALGRPLPATYRLLGMEIWPYDTEAVELERQPPADLAPAPDLLADTASLPYHPFFPGWFVGGEQATRMARQMMRQCSTAGARGANVEPETLHTFACRLAEAYFDRPTREQIQARLRAMCEWLWETEQLPLVELAMTAAETVVRIPPAKHPLLLSMAELGLNLVVHQPQSGRVRPQ